MITFNETILIGELQFEVSGSYSEEDSISPLNFDSVSLSLTIDSGTITFDATELLDSLDAWGKLEAELMCQLPETDTLEIEDYD
jgi:hypothetical protein